MTATSRRTRRKPPEALPPAPTEAIGLDLFSTRDLLQRLYADRSSSMGDGEDDSAQAARQRALWLRLHEDERGARRSLIMPDAALIARIAALDLICSQFSEVTAWILRAATLAMAGGQPLRLDPCVLLGPPGVGKTFYARRLAEAFSVPTLTIPMNLVTDRGSWFSGLAPVWRASGPGKIAQLLIDSDSASPVIVIDEIEKSSPINPTETPINVLHSLLERENARVFQDEFLEIPLRADAIIWIATANDLSPLPASIVDRLIAFEINLEPDQMLAIQRSRFAEANAASGNLFETPPEALFEELASLTPRALSRLWPLAFGFACMSSRRHVTRADLTRAEGVLGVDRGKRSRIGFLTEMTSPSAPGRGNRAGPEEQGQGMKGRSERNGETPPGNLANPIDKKDPNMTANQPRQPAHAASLHSLVIDRTKRPVVDELAALRLENPSDADYAAFFRNTPSIAAVATRARHHAEEAARFVTMVQNTDEATFKSHVGQLFSVVILNNIANIAIALLPARAAVDRHAKREQGYAVLGTLDDPHDNPLRSIGQIAFGLRRIDPVQVAHDAIAFAAASGRAHEEPGRATVHSLEEQATLNVWLAREIDTDAVMDEAFRHVRAATRFARSARDDLGPAEYEHTLAAQEGAILQQLIALARIALAPQAHDARARLQSACEQMTARPQARATLELAMAMGDHLRSMITSHRS